MKGIIMTVLVGAIFCACQKEEVSTWISNSGHDIYVAGVYRTSTGNYSAAYWKNGVLHDLPGSSNSTIRSIFVDGDDVYCLGNDIKTDSMLMWKNDKKFRIDKSHYGSSLVVSNGDIFIAGVQTPQSRSLHGIARYWKNGVAVNLTDGSSDASASSIVVHNGDIYVTGNENKIAKYWKNGVGVNLTKGTSYAMATSIFVNDEGVYVCGYEFDGGGISAVAKYWENGAINFLEGGALGTAASTIIASGNDLYVGYHMDDGNWGLPKYMKNGKIYSLPFRGYIQSMKVVNDDVYILGSGTFGIGPFQWMLLKNGVRQRWQNDTQLTYAQCFFVK